MRALQLVTMSVWVVACSQRAPADAPRRAPVREVPRAAEQPPPAPARPVPGKVLLDGSGDSAGEALVVARLPEVELASVHAGGPITVRTGSGSLRTGTVDFIEPLVDPARHTVEVRVRVRNRDRVLKAASFVELIPIVRGPAAAAPEAAGRRP